MRVKCHYKDTRTVLVSRDHAWEHVCQRLNAKFHTQHLSFSYKDQEGDLIEIHDDEDYQVALLEMGDRVEIFADDA